MITPATKTTILRIALLAALGLALALPAWARGRAGRNLVRPARPVRPHFAHPHALLGQLIFPCPTACGDEARDCIDAADDTALTCITDACSAEVDAAQTACPGDRSSTECHDAVEALAECASDCLDSRADAVSACRESLIDCRDTCDAE